MSTMVVVHAHPDDEAIMTGGTIARAVAEGYRVVVVFATRGEKGEEPEDLGDEPLGERREREARAAAAVLGAHRVEFLGYEDSGMTHDASSSRSRFCAADIDEAAARLEMLLVEESAAVLVGYEPRGGSGHPDHVMVHHVARRAAESAGTPFVYEVAMNRDHFAGLIAAAHEMGLDVPSAPTSMDDFGVAAADITFTVDVREHAMEKRSAMAAHASQIADTSVFLAVPEKFFPNTWGYEWYIQRRGPQLDPLQALSAATTQPSAVADLS